MTADSPAVMGKVFTALAVSVDGFITGRGPGPGQGLGDGGILFGWYFDGDTPSQLLDGLYADLRHLHRSRHRERPRPRGRPGHRGHGRRFFQDLPAHIGLSLVEAVPAPGVTHLRYQVEK